MQRRKQVRHRLASDVAFLWEGPQHTALHGEGITRDISLSGAFIFSLRCPPVAATVQVDILLLPLGGGATLAFRGDALLFVYLLAMARFWEEAAGYAPAYPELP